MPRYTPKTKSDFWPHLLGLGTFLFPLTLAHVDFRSAFPHGLAIHPTRSSPAFAAFEDSYESFSEPDEWDRFVEPTQTLASGTPISGKLPVAEMKSVLLAGLTVRAPILTPRVTEPLDPTRDEAHSTIVASSTLNKFDLNDRDLFPTAPLTPVAKRAFDLSQSALRAHPLAGDREIFAAPLEVTSATSPVPVLASEPAPRETRPEISPTDSARPIWLKGQIEMVGGLGYWPETRLLIKRVVGGQAVETGDVWVTEGRFEIHVRRAEGLLVAELVQSDGRLMGRGEIDLQKVRAKSPHENLAEGLKIAVRPASESANLNLVASYAPRGHDANPVEGTIETLPGEVFSARTSGRIALDRQSTFLARGHAKKSWSTLALGHAGEPQDVRVFSDRLVTSLIQLSLPPRDAAAAEQNAIVWGQIKRNDQLVAGARVELAEGPRAIYFNEAYVPDPSLEATGPNGLFAFVDVKAGVQAAQVREGTTEFPAQIFPTEARHVSQVDFQLHENVTAKVVVQDVLQPGQPLKADVRLLGSDKNLVLGSESKIEFPLAANTFMVEADAGPEFEISRATVSGNQPDIHLPMVKREWLKRLATEAGVTLQPGHGVVAGLVDDRDFVVDFASATPAASTRVIYVDAKGLQVAGEHGIAGGGFVIFNAPVGVQTAFIHPAGRRESFGQVVVPESGVVHVMTYSDHTR